MKATLDTDSSVRRVPRASAVWQGARARGSVMLAVAAAAAIVTGCTALQELAALRNVVFAFDRVADVRVAGIAIGEGASYSRLSVADLARVAAAVASRNVPLELVAHVSASNPAENRVAARLVNVDWTLFVDDRRLLSGVVNESRSIAPGSIADLPVPIRFDLYELSQGGARDLFETALAIAGYGTRARELRFELLPRIETTLGPIQYPTPVVIRRAAR
ncbi:MAG: LEA type 2 family protein [Candidatus Eisenbacteria bacterium]|uniref:LEA type 2 family protein n=1 Tax=Eiseniibacteriota bacterium TaxID=2212470 RepID=A0A849SN95_UNCEI|nr:LEA type 2 family protein [Candidatus Eisenbacteria bacterium]